jgi:alkyldihydroxyacetonephosphate synthase
MEWLCESFKQFNTYLTMYSMREVALKRAQPVSIRLMDNTQFQMGQCLTPESDSKFGWMTDSLKHAYLTKWARFDLEKMVACTILFEGEKEEVDRQQKVIYALADKHKGINGGQTNGRKGYFLTYMIAYLRDYSFGYYLIGESFETSIPWANVLDVCYRVTERIENCAEEFELPYAPMCSYRVTQLYDTGACVYFYFGFIFRGLADPVKKFNDIEGLARDEVLACGGSISHHHGIGKLRRQWMGQCNSELGNQMVASIKSTLDPTNVLGSGNLLGLVGPTRPNVN